MGLFRRRPHTLTRPPARRFFLLRLHDFLARWILRPYADRALLRTISDQNFQIEGLGDKLRLAQEALESQSELMERHREHVRADIATESRRMVESGPGAGGVANNPNMRYREGA